jgi:hypothetical protein
MGTVRAYLCAAAFAACFYAYIDTFSVIGSLTMDRLTFVIFPLFFLVVLTLIVEHLRNPELDRITLRGILRRAALPMRLSYWFVLAFFAAHFAFFLVAGHGGMPEILDGQFVSASHGTIIRVLTESQYLNLKSALARAVAGFFMCVFFSFFLRWWTVERAGVLSDSLREERHV